MPHPTPKLEGQFTPFVRHLDVFKNMFLEAMSQILKSLVISTIRTSTNPYPFGAKFIHHFLRSHNCHILLLYNAYKVVCIKINLSLNII